MTSNDGLDRRLTAWLDEEAAPLAPHGLSETITESVGEARRLPGWATSERWISMETRARLGAVPRAAIILATLALLTALAAGAIVVGSSSAPKLPAPFGAADNGLIAFVSEGDIYVIEPDGSDRRQITSGLEGISGPTWSRDGTRLAYWTGPAGEPAGLVVTDVDGSDPVAVATTLGPDYEDLEWSADGAGIMYSEIVPGLGSDPCPVIEGGACGSRLFIARVDGSGSSQVGDPDLDARGPTLSPDGSTVAFGGGEAASEALYVMQWDGSDIERLETGLSGGGWAFAKQSWSADGQRIVTQPGSGIWIVELDGSGQVEGTERLGSGVWPSYSPDGSAIDTSGPAGRMIWAPDDEGASVVLSGVPNGPAWAPDSTRVVGIRGSDLVVYGRDGETIAELGPTDDGKPSWQRVAP